jgi:hypothetical protein
MADADALLIRKLIVASLEGGDAHTDWGKAFGTRPVISPLPRASAKCGLVWLVMVG